MEFHVTSDDERLEIMAVLFFWVAAPALAGGLVSVAAATVWMIRTRKWRQPLAVLAGGLGLLVWPVLPSLLVGVPVPVDVVTEYRAVAMSIVPFGLLGTGMLLVLLGVGRLSAFLDPGLGRALLVHPRPTWARRDLHGALANLGSGLGCLLVLSVLLSV